MILKKKRTKNRSACPECEGTGELTYGIGANAGYIGDGEGYEEDVCWRCKGSGKTIKKRKTIKK